MNPGSKEAIAAGCSCPVSDNHYGEGVPLPEGPAFWMDLDCPIHGLTTWDE